MTTEDSDALRNQVGHPYVDLRTSIARELFCTALAKYSLIDLPLVTYETLAFRAWRAADDFVAKGLEAEQAKQ